MSGDYWNNLIRHSMSRTQVEVSITKDYAWELFLSQNRLCALSGESLYLGSFSERTASLDRIDSGLGYIPGNVQWVHKDLNRMKNTFDVDYFIDMCRKVAQLHT